MKAGQALRRLGRLDLKLVGRDRFLIMMFGFVIYIAVMLRFGLPWLNDYLQSHGVLPNDHAPFPLSDVYPMLVTFFAVFNGSMITGTIAGFMLIDEKDGRTLKAQLVTPLPFNQYALYRCVAPMALGFLIILFMVWAIDLALIPTAHLLLIALGGALTTPLFTFFYGIYGENKVQGIAISKLVGILGWTIPIGWFIADPFPWLFGLFPPFLICKAYWMSLHGDPLWWAALLLGSLLQLALLGWMVKRFNTVAYRT